MTGGQRDAVNVLLLHKALVNGSYQKKAEAIAKLPGVHLTVVVPPSWREARWGEVRLERRHTDGYQLEVAPIVANGHHHVHFYPTLGAIVRRARPDIFHVDEEPFNIATAHAFYWGRRAGAKLLFVTWATVNRTYPPPFSWCEHYTHRHAGAAIAGNSDALAVLRGRGYAGPVTIVPLGLDLELFPPRPLERTGPLMVGYLGRLVQEKGVHILLEAFAQGGDTWRLRLIGGGDRQRALVEQARRLGVANRVEFSPMAPSAQVPELLRGLDVLVVPSLTTPTWKEQFGRVIIEAMASRVPVIGSDSGEIPRVIEDAGLIVPEGSVPALAGALARLAADSALWRRLACDGRQRVSDHFTWDRIAGQYQGVYQQLVASLGAS